MNENCVRICCYNLFDEELTSLERLKEVMTEIEQGINPRPEFELHFSDNFEKQPVYAAALFREGGGGIVEGWFLWHVQKGIPNFEVYCREIGTKNRVDDFRRVIKSGAPSIISTNAILTRHEALMILESLAQKKPISAFEILPGRSVQRRNG